MVPIQIRHSDKQGTRTIVTCSAVLSLALLLPTTGRADCWDKTLDFGKDLLAKAATNYTHKYQQELTQLLQSLRQPGTAKPFLNTWFSLDQFQGIKTAFFMASHEKRRDIEDILTNISGRERRPQIKPPAGDGSADHSFRISPQSNESYSLYLWS